MRWLFAPILLVAACASAKVQGGNNEIDANNNGDDAPPPVDMAPPIDNPPPIDAPPDAPPQPIQSTLQEPTTTAVTAANSVNCNNFQSGGSGTTENHYFRVFTLADFGITKDFNVTQVTFAVEQASGAAQTATVKVGTYSAVVNAGTTTLDPTKIANLNQVNTNIAIGATNIVTPITATIPAGATIIVEIASPDGTGVSPQRALFPGTNNSGQKKPSFVSAPACNINAITSYANLGFPQVQLIMSVTGTHLP